MSDADTNNGVEPIEMLQAWDLAGRTYSAFFANIGPLFKAMVVPLVLAILFGRLMSWLVGDPFAAMEGGETNPAIAMWSGGAGLFNLIGSLVLGYLMLAYAVTCHRINLIGPGEKYGFFGVGFSKREWRFIGYSLAIWAVSFVAILIFGLVTVTFGQAVSGESSTTIAILVAIPVGIYVVMVSLRFMITLPMVAVDGPTGLRANLRISWNLVKGSTLALFIAFILVNLPFFVIAMIVGALTGVLSFFGETLTPMIVIQDLSDFISVALTATLLSNAFRTLTGFNAPGVGHRE